MIPKEFWERFKNEKIAVNCQTEDEAKDFVKQCYDNGIIGRNAKYNKTNYQEYESKTCYRCDLTNILCFYSIIGYKSLNYTIIPFSKINKPIKEENKMSDFNYRGKEFNDPVEYANYILKCAEEDKAKAEKIKREKLEFERETRYKELEKEYTEYVNICKTAREKYHNICKNYINDYKPALKNTENYLIDFDISKCFDSLIKSLSTL